MSVLSLDVFDEEERSRKSQWFCAASFVANASVTQHDVSRRYPELLCTMNDTLLRPAYNCRVVLQCAKEW
jgi:hypothetical protein